MPTFGSLQDVVEAALQRYGLDYPTFVQRTAEDEDFVQEIEKKVSKTWELDLAEWEFCYEGIKDWTHKLQDILLT